MSGILTIMWKEIRDNLRDKRSLFFAFVYGPLLMPGLMLGPIIFTANKHIQNYDSGKELRVYGGDRAPNLLSYLKSKNLDTKEIGENFREQIKNGDVTLVLEISENYGEKLLEGQPAKVIIHFLEENHDSRNFFWQVRGELDGYGRMLASHRMMIRGFDQNLLRPIDISENDLSEEEAGTSALANILMFLVVFSCMMGGFYLAIDITTGERERFSLEPLLSLALTRTQVVMGKYLTILLFCAVSFILPVISVAIWASFLPDKFFGNADIPGVVTYLKIILLSVPICLMFASVLMAVAAFSKSVKEAQTQLGIGTIIPMIPFFVVMFADVDSDAVSTAIPVLGQYLIADKIMMDATYPLVTMLPSAITSVLVAAFMLVIAVQLYRKDSILGN